MAEQKVKAAEQDDGKLKFIAVCVSDEHGLIGLSNDGRVMAYFWPEEPTERAGVLFDGTTGGWEELPRGDREGNLTVRHPMKRG